MINNYLILLLKSIFLCFPENSSIGQSTSTKIREPCRFQLFFLFLFNIVLSIGQRKRMVTFFPRNKKKENNDNTKRGENRGETRSECNTFFRFPRRP